MAAWSDLVLRQLLSRRKHRSRVLPEKLRRSPPRRRNWLQRYLPAVFQMLRLFLNAASVSECKYFHDKIPSRNILFFTSIPFYLTLFSPRTQEKKAQKSGFLFRFRSRFFCVFSYSFTAPSVIPVTKYFCRNGYTISIGTRAINTFAASSDLLEFCANC